ncbi:MAG: 8-amino-7-oxononanoate synthase [Xanthomonadaceae bacterium]|jgi:8-amino-7-oxononanoate synthase|nr:8-amino-7-oxononanoate synthase [Xanthomonadaceae bacterium]
MARPDLFERIRSLRDARIAQNRLRVRRTVTRRDGITLDIDGHRYANFSGNDYLGLAQQFEIIDALQDGTAREGVGATASPLICGYDISHENLEREVAEWIGYPRGLLFGSGFMANLAVQQALLTEENDVCVQDRLNHASLIDATHLAGCRLRRYPHLDAEGAIRQLKGTPGGAAILATDGVFSMDGDIAPLQALSLAAKVQQALLYVDDAHGVGVLGPDGRGSVAAAGLGPAEVPLLLVPLSKALGSYGAVVLGSEALINHLIETSRPYAYSSALPPALATAALTAVRSARRDEWRRERLKELIGVFREECQRYGIEPLMSDTPIQPLLCGSETEAVALSAAMEREGYLTAAIRPPTVPEGTSRIRITLSALHAPQQVQRMVTVLARCREELPKH